MAEILHEPRIGTINSRQEFEENLETLSNSCQPAYSTDKETDKTWVSSWVPQARLAEVMGLEGACLPSLLPSQITAGQGGPGNSDSLRLPSSP